MNTPRSILIMPANRADMLAKAPGYGADALMFDIEDSVPVGEKAKAREIAADFITKYRSRGNVFIRANSHQSGMLEDDLEALAIDGLAGLRLPKTETPEMVRDVDRILSKHEAARGLKPGSIEISPSFESAKGIWFAYEILSASPRIRSCTAGTAQDGDLQADIGYTWTPQGEEVLYIRSRILVAARAVGVDHVLDGSYANIRDPDGLKVCCEAIRKLGYRGKTAIHPKQIETINGVFMPTAKEIDYYRRVIMAFDEALTRGSAATTVDGKLVDYAMVATAKRVLAWAGGVPS